MNIPRVDELSTDTSVLGRHNPSVKKEARVGACH